MKEPIYVKKYIKSEEDLPKKTGDFFVCDKDGISKYLHYEAHPTFNSARYWLDRLDWYLQPVELPSDEEIKAEFTKESYHYEIGRHYKILKDRIFGAKWLRDKLMK